MAQLAVVDYSARAAVPDAQLAADLAAAGIGGVMRYAVRDWRGCTAGELAALMAAAIRVGFVHEGVEDRLLSGFNGGAADASYANDVVLSLGAPAAAPIYFASDWDAQNWDLPAIDDYLAGAASIIGVDRVGVYGGLRVVSHCAEAGTARRTWQTSAWSWVDGVLTWHPANDLEQFDYNHWIGGTNCDDCRPTSEDWGQMDAAAPAPAFPAAILPPDFFDQLAKPVPEVILWQWEGRTLHLQPTRRNVRMRRNSNEYTEPTTSSEHAGILLPKGRRVAIERQTAVKSKLPSGKSQTRLWLTTREGTWIPADSADPHMIIEPWTAGKKAA